MFVRKDRGRKESYIELFQNKSWKEKLAIISVPILIIYLLVAILSCNA